MKKIFFLIIITLCFTCCKEEIEEEQIYTENNQIFTIWNGNSLIFEKIDGSDPLNESNQDRITDNVWITRDNEGGQIYNIAKENSADKSKSPIGTEWAIGNLDQIGTIEFKSFRLAVGKPQDVVGKDLVIHLLDDDVYLSIKFKSWSQGQKGGFSYERSTQ